jgi:hypothetical protein
MKLLVISDIHGKWAALQAVLKAEPNVDRILCLGDLVDYGPEPVACVGWALRQQGSNTILVQGNHDWGVAEKKDPRACPLYRELAAVTQTYCLTVLSPKMQTFEIRLNRMIVFFRGIARACAVGLFVALVLAAMPWFEPDIQPFQTRLIDFIQQYAIPICSALLIWYGLRAAR